MRKFIETIKTGNGYSHIHYYTVSKVYEAATFIGSHNGLSEPLVTSRDIDEVRLGVQIQLDGDK